MAFVLVQCSLAACGVTGDEVVHCEDLLPPGDATYSQVATLISTVGGAKSCSGCHNTRTPIFDVSDLESPVLTGSHTGAFAAIDHNQYVRDGFLYQANYTIGLRILDLADVADGNLSEVAFFDTRPESDRRAFEGAWSVYPFFDSCTVIVSDIERGLFVLRPEAHCVPSPPLIEPDVR